MALSEYSSLTPILNSMGLYHYVFMLWFMIPWAGCGFTLLGNPNTFYSRRVLQWCTLCFSLVALGWFMLCVYDPMYCQYPTITSDKQVVYLEHPFSGMVALLSLLPALALYWAGRKTGETARALGSLGCVVMMMFFGKVKDTTLFLPFLLLLMLIARPLLLDTTSEKPHTSRLNKSRFFCIFALCMLWWYIQFFQSTAGMLTMIDEHLGIILAIPMALFIPWPTKSARQRFSATPLLGKVMAMLVLCGVIAIPLVVDTYRLEVLIRMYTQKEMGTRVQG